MTKLTLTSTIAPIATALPLAVSAGSLPSDQAIHYRTVQVDGLSIFYREAGPVTAPTILLLHGFPSSSRMYEPIMTRLAAHYHLIAPDFPGFGYSDAPSPTTFSYTFDHIANVIEQFTETLGMKSYAMFVQDYGGPVGMRMAIAHPERLRALIIQNAVSHENGLGPLWKKRRDFWANRQANEADLRATFFSLATTRQRHIGTNPQPDSVDPDRWNDEFAFLSRPGQAEIQSDLFYDYRNNVSSYPAWSTWLRKNQPRTLVVWGKYDPSFQVDEIAAYQRDLPNAETHILDAGHFALYDVPDQISGLVKNFLDRE